MHRISEIEKELFEGGAIIPDFRIGDTVKVHQKIIEGNKERIQVFEGVVIAKDNKGISKTFTVRRISYDVGVERVFPLFSPRIAKIELVRSGHVRRSKLYFLREKIGKSGRIKEKKYTAVVPGLENSAPAGDNQLAQKTLETKDNSNAEKTDVKVQEGNTVSEEKKG